MVFLSSNDKHERDLKKDEYEFDLALSYVQAEDTVKNITSLCDGIPHEKILEIGCGSGAVLSRLSRIHFADSMFGLDKSKDAVEFTKSKNIKRLDDCIVFDTDEREKFPYEDNTFDLAILSHVIEHVKYPHALLDYAGKSARYVFIEVPLEDSLVEVDVPLEDNLQLETDYDDEDGHRNVYSYNSIRRLILSIEFKIIEQKTTIPSFETFLHRYELEHKIWRAGLEYIPLKLALKLGRWEFIRRKTTLIFDCYNNSILCKRC